MTAPRHILLIVSHLVVLGLAYEFAHNLKPVTEGTARAVSDRTRWSNRSVVTTSSDGPRLLAEFRSDYLGKKSRYEELKESLQPAADLQAAAIASMEDWENATSDQSRLEAYAMMQARFYHWLRASPSAAMRYLSTPETEGSAMRVRSLIHLLGIRVLTDAAREIGVMNSLDWLTMNPAGLLPMWTTLIGEMRNGGGLALFLQFEEALADHSKSWLSGYQVFESLREVGAAVRFSEKERLLDDLKLQTDEDRTRALLLGFAGTSDAAATWVMGLVERGELPENVVSRMRGGIGNEVLRQPMMDMEMRIAARRFTEGNENKPREAILGELVANDVKRLLNEGRDWRYEFRHGTATLDEILEGVNGALKIPDEGRERAHIALYRDLSEEDPGKALPLLDLLPEEQRREILFSNTWQSYGNINPDDFIAYVNQLPEPVTEKEKQDRMKGWDWKVRGLLQRHGDDYVEWVAALPSNPDKYAAINSIIWATRELNPEKPVELNQRFYPKKP